MNIKIQNLSFHYHPQRPVLQNINLSIEKPAIIVFLGLNGCGKTTLIKSLAGLLNTIQGKILYDNQHILDLSIPTRSKLISYVAQRSVGIEDVRVIDYLTYGLINTMKFYHRPRPQHIATIQKTAKKLQIEHLLSKQLGEISGGERQIVAICAALIQDASTILLDEPTSALDIKNQMHVLQTLKDIAKDKIIILSTHNPNHALYLDAQVALICDGTINTFAPARDCITVRTLKHIYGKHLIESAKLPYQELSFY